MSSLLGRCCDSLLQKCFPPLKFLTCRDGNGIILPHVNLMNLARGRLEGLYSAKIELGRIGREYMVTSNNDRLLHFLPNTKTLFNQYWLKCSRLLIEHPAVIVGILPDCSKPTVRLSKILFTLLQLPQYQQYKNIVYAGKDLK